MNFSFLWEKFFLRDMGGGVENSSVFSFLFLFEKILPIYTRQYFLWQDGIMEVVSENGTVIIYEGKK